MSHSLVPYHILPYPSTLLPYTPTKDTHMNPERTLTAIIDRTLSALEKNVNRPVSDEKLIQTLEFIGTLQDMRVRQERYTKK